MSKDGELSNTDLCNKLLAAIRTENQSTKSDIKSELKKVNDNILMKIEEQNKKISELEKKCNKLEQNFLPVERRLRKNNIIIFGLEVKDETELLGLIITFFKDALGVDVDESDLNNLYTIKSEKGTPVKVEFVSFLKKSSILKNLPKLKGTRTFIAQDLCIEDRKDLKILKHHLKEARAKNIFARIKGNKLLVNDEFYTPEQLVNMTSFEPRTIGQKSLQEVVINARPNSVPSTPTSIIHLPIETTVNDYLIDVNDVNDQGIHGRTFPHVNLARSTAHNNSEQKTVSASRDHPSASQIVTRQKLKK